MSRHHSVPPHPTPPHPTHPLPPSPPSPPDPPPPVLVFAKGSQYNGKSESIFKPQPRGSDLNAQQYADLSTFKINAHLAKAGRHTINLSFMIRPSELKGPADGHWLNGLFATLANTGRGRLNLVHAAPAAFTARGVTNRYVSRSHHQGGSL